MKRTRRNFIRSCLFSLFSLCSLAGFTKSENNCSNHRIRRILKPQVPPESSYVKLHLSGDLKRRGEELWESLSRCKLCPRKSAINRFSSSEGTCKAPSKLKISSYFRHFGEEEPLTGRKGSGTIFFSHCGLRCVYCQNWEISIGGQGKYKTIDDLANMMLSLQKLGCHNINLVTPTHYSPTLFWRLILRHQKDCDYLWYTILGDMKMLKLSKSLMV